MNREIAESILTQELGSTKKIGYLKLTERIGGQPIIRDVVASDGKRYQLEINIFWDGKKNGPIRLMGCVDDGGWRSFIPLTLSDLVYPE
jgi:hypothetical protein